MCESVNRENDGITEGFVSKGDSQKTRWNLYLKTLTTKQKIRSNPFLTQISNDYSPKIGGMKRHVEGQQALWSAGGNDMNTLCGGSKKGGGIGAIQQLTALFCAEFNRIGCMLIDD